MTEAPDDDGGGDGGDGNGDGDGDDGDDGGDDLGYLVIIQRKIETFQLYLQNYHFHLCWCPQNLEMVGLKTFG